MPYPTSNEALCPEYISRVTQRSGINTRFYLLQLTVCPKFSMWHMSLCRNWLRSTLDQSRWKKNTDGMLWSSRMAMPHQSQEHGFVRAAIRTSRTWHVRLKIAGQEVCMCSDQVLTKIFKNAYARDYFPHIKLVLRIVHPTHFSQLQKPPLHLQAILHLDYRLISC